MTDNEIIKALECCKSMVTSCEECPMHIEGVICHEYELNEKALDIIKRQQAEIERLKIDLEAMRGAANSYKHHYNKARSEAVKEFAMRLKCGVPQETGVIRCSDIDNLVKEILGEENV